MVTIITLSLPSSQVSKRWPNGEVPYVIEDAFDDNFRVITMAMTIIIAIITILLPYVSTITS